MSPMINTQVSFHLISEPEPSLRRAQEAYQIIEKGLSGFYGASVTRGNSDCKNGLTVHDFRARTRHCNNSAKALKRSSKKHVVASSSKKLTNSKKKITYKRIFDSFIKDREQVLTKIEYALHIYQCDEESLKTTAEKISRIYQVPTEHIGDLNYCDESAWDTLELEGVKSNPPISFRAVQLDSELHQISDKLLSKIELGSVAHNDTQIINEFSFERRAEEGHLFFVLVEKKRRRHAPAMTAEVFSMASHYFIRKELDRELEIKLNTYGEDWSLE